MITVLRTITCFERVIATVQSERRERRRSARSARSCHTFLLAMLSPLVEQDSAATDGSDSFSLSDISGGRFQIMLAADAADQCGLDATALATTSCGSEDSEFASFFGGIQAGQQQDCSPGGLGSPASRIFTVRSLDSDKVPAAAVGTPPHLLRVS